MWHLTSLRLVAFVTACAFVMACAVGVIVLATSQPVGEVVKAEAVSSSAGDDRFHSFGVVAPNAECIHTFPLENPTNVRRTIRSIQVGCSCTIPSVSSMVIEPGATEEVTVSLTTPRGVADLSKAVTIDFRESDIEPVVLRVHAAVRPPITLSSEYLSFSNRPRKKARTRYIQVSNFGDEEWTGLTVEGLPDWLHADSQKLPTSSNPPKPRQVWRLSLKAIRPPTLTVGRHSAALAVAPSGASVASAALNVAFEVAPPVRLSPGRLFLGEIPPHAATPITFYLIASNEVIKGEEENINITHDLAACSVDLHCQAHSAGVCIVRGTIRPACADTYLKGSLRIAFPRDLMIPELFLSLSAKVGT